MEGEGLEGITFCDRTGTDLQRICACDTLMRRLDVVKAQQRHHFCVILAPPRGLLQVHEARWWPEGGSYVARRFKALLRCGSKHIQALSPVRGGSPRIFVLCCVAARLVERQYVHFE